MNDADPKPIGDAISSTLRELGLQQRIRQYEVLEVWETIVGEQIAKVTAAQRIDDGKLFVHVFRAPWRNELTFLKKDIIAKINAAFQEEIVKDIIFR